MNHFIINYHVIIDNNLPIEGMTGNVVFGAKHSRDYKPLRVAEFIREEYRLMYPNAQEIRVRFQDVALVEEAQYDKVRDGFTVSRRLSRVG